MRIALGVHVSTYEVTASLVDCGLPELGPIATRTVPVGASPGGIGGAVEAALGFMRVQARQNDLEIAGAAVVCENALQREIVADALAQVESPAPVVVDIFDTRMSDRFTPDVSVALLIDEEPAPMLRAEPVAVERRGMWPVAALGACVLAALGGVTAWAMTTEPPEGSNAPVEMVYPTGAPGESGTTAPSPTPVLPDASAPEAVPDVARVDAVSPLPPVTTPQPESDPGRVITTAPPVESSMQLPLPTTPSPTRTTRPTTPGNGGGSTTTTTTPPSSTTQEPGTTSEASTTTPAPTSTAE